MKKLLIIVISVLSFGVAGCQEIEKPGMAEEKTKSVLVNNVDLSLADVSGEAAVYSAVFLRDNPEKIAGIFLGKDFEEGEASAEGRRFIANAGTKEEKMVIVGDGGRSFFGESGHSADTGIIFSGREDFVDALNYNTEVGQLMEEYQDAGKISEKSTEETDEEFALAKEKTGDWLEQLKMEKYVLDADVAVELKDLENKKGYLMFWRQTIDEIPVSDILLENEGNKTVYNYRHQICNPELQACSSAVETAWVEGELAEWYNYGMVGKEKVLKKYSVVSAEQAYEKVEECYPAESAASGEVPVLERAQLQYEILKRGESLYLYPIWLFGVKESDGGWCYYLMDAATGDFFTDIPEEITSKSEYKDFE